MAAAISIGKPVGFGLRRWCITVKGFRLPAVIWKETQVNYSNYSAPSFPEFKSAYSLDKIYADSSLNLNTIPEPPKNSEEKFSGYIPIDKLKISYSRSSGPGGQNVNKVNTKVEIRFHLSTADWIPESVRNKMLEIYKTSINKEGYFMVNSDKTRTQTLNLADCMDKIRCMIREASRPPPEVLPETRQMLKARQDRASSMRLRQKRIHSSIKKDRQSPTLQDI
ncbi:peptidyl-tRNA hydrolase ICT1, mitochondrial-like [Limulus polyphemus]|uniref:Large ribosomal subunit protein mL62 n=1 Tax=Limulus polyphemus TaxID=6850 RepID=A0ABM1BE07_LIMPO|nr:peptidyl-tRNA hydrolase ICT1, mitochondrial-like [Limulus polyphemus]